MISCVSLRNSALLATFAVIMCATTTFAAAYQDFFGRQWRLTAKDLQLFQMSLREVLKAGLPGASASWEDRDTNEGGRASILRIYERNGMTCAEVEHIFTSGNRYRYVLPFCLKDGEWKMAF
jgi:hypothetical protein